MTEVKGFIPEFRDTLITRIPGIKFDWATMCAESTLAGCCYKIRFYDRMGELNLNLWGMGIGPSGEYKSAPIKYYVIPVYRKVTKLLKEDNISKDLIIPSRFSEEGLIDFMTFHKETKFNPETGKDDESTTIRNEGLMVRDEFTGFMKGVKDKQWLTTLSEIMSEIYDSQIQPYYTIKRRFQSVPYCNISFLSATTPYLYEVMDEPFFIQGLGNRINFVVWGYPKTFTEEDLSFFEPKSDEKHAEIIDYFAQKLYGVIKSPLTKMMISDDPRSDKSCSLWIDYDKEVKERKSKLPRIGLGGLKFAYLSRNREKTLKRACVYCVSRSIDKLSESSLPELVVREMDMQTAIKREEIYYKHFVTLLKAWAKTPKGRERTDIRDLIRTMSVLTDSKFHMLTTEQWLKGAGYHRNKFYKLKDTLVSQDDVRSLTEQEMHKLTAERLSELGIGPHSKASVWRPTDQYYKEEGIKNPFTNM